MRRRVVPVAIRNRLPPAYMLQGIASAGPGGARYRGKDGNSPLRMGGRGLPLSSRLGTGDVTTLDS